MCYLNCNYFFDCYFSLFSVTHSSANHFVSPSFSTRQYWLTGTESERDIEELVASGRGVGVVRLQVKSAAKLQLL